MRLRVCGWILAERGHIVRAFQHAGGATIAAALLLPALLCVAVAADAPTVPPAPVATNQAPLAPADIDVVCDAYPPDHIFTNDVLILPTQVRNRTGRVLTCTVRTTLAAYRPNEEGATVAVCESHPRLAPGSLVPVPARFQPPAAAPYALRVSVTETDQAPRQIKSTLLYKPQDWALPELEPRDFDAFWQQTLAEVNARPLESQEREPADRRLIPEPFREVSFNGLGNRRIHGYFGLPPQRQPGQRVPAILALPSAGYHAAAVEPAALREGYAFLAISIHDLPFGGESGRTHPRETWLAEPYQGIGRQSRETFYYRAAYVAGPRAVEYLRARPEIDPNRIIVTGFSQGGSLALATAGLVPDLALAEAGIAGRSRMDLLTFMYKANMSLDPPAGMTSQEMLERTLVYFDVSYFARRVHCPLLMRCSLDDETNPGPLQYWAFLQATHSPDARLSMRPWLKHAMPSDPQNLVQAMRQKYAPAAAAAAAQKEAP